jgi:demethylmenaquinone methyltransferase/2-methoxy-6-polyprenyl-1,4-benzoquinol methylase
MIGNFFDDPVAYKGNAVMLPYMLKIARNPQTTASSYFGFRPVKTDDKTRLVQGVFDSVAPRYDLMNDLMSAGLHRLWKDSLVRMINPKPEQVILDVAGGTGDIAMRCHRATQGKACITVCDLNSAMLAHGRAKAIDHGILSGIDWIEGNAEKLPVPDRSVDVYIIGFGLRNVTHIDAALREATRVLRPGGRFFCLEFSPGVNRLIKPWYEKYCLEMLPRIGEFIAQDREAYRYLAESILRFPHQPALAKRIENAGLHNVKFTNFTGGIAVVHTAWRL